MERASYPMLTTTKGAREKCEDIIWSIHLDTVAWQGVPWWMVWSASTPSNRRCVGGDSRALVEDQLDE